MNIEINRAKLFYKTIGRGSPLIFLHGGFGMDHSYFLPYVKPLAKRFRLIFFDFRGNGKSESTPLETYTYRQFVEDIKELIKKLKLRKVYLLGHSAGGFIALKFALRYPQYLKGLILADTFPGGLRRKKSWHPEKFDSDDRFKQATLKDLLGAFRPKNQEVGRKMLEQVIYRKDVFERLIRFEAPKWDVRKELPNIKTPTLVIAGEYDAFGKNHPNRFLRGSKILVRKIPNSKLEVIKDSGHFPFVEKPAEFSKVIVNFLK